MRRMRREKLLVLIKREARINEKDDVGIDEFIERRDARNEQ